MVEDPRWHVAGDWFDVCSCNVPCPCTFAQPPTGNHCQGVMAYHVREGHYGDVRLDGLNLVAVGEFEGNIWEGGEFALGLFVDERANPAQQEALQRIFSGEAGGWPGKFAELVTFDMRGVEVAPVTVAVSEDLSRFVADVPGRVRGVAEALSGPTTPEGARVPLTNPPGAEPGPGQGATWAVAMTDQVDLPAFGFSWQWDGKASTHIPFDWSGPDE